jgi:hypothetical protein
VDPTSRRIPGEPSATRSGLRVYAGHRPATQSPEDRQNGARFDTPTRYMKKASEPRFRRSEALSHTWWQVKDSNLRSFRDGFTDQRLQACDQRQYLSPDNFRAYSPQSGVTISVPETSESAIAAPPVVVLAFVDPSSCVAACVRH